MICILVWIVAVSSSVDDSENPDMTPSLQKTLLLEQAEGAMTGTSSTRSGRSSSTRSGRSSSISSIPEVGDIVTIQPIHFELPEFWHGNAALARPPTISEHTVTLGAFLGKGKDAWGFSLNNNMVIKIFKTKQIKKFQEEFKVQFITSALSWLYSRDRPHEPTIAYLIPSPVLLHISLDNVVTKYFGFALRFLPRFLDTKMDFIPMDHFELVHGFQDFVNRGADLQVWDEQGYYHHSDCLFMTDAQLHPDRRVKEGEHSRIWPGEQLLDPKIKSCVINAAFVQIFESLRRLGCKVVSYNSHP